MSTPRKVIYASLVIGLVLVGWQVWQLSGVACLLAHPPDRLIGVTARASHVTIEERMRRHGWDALTSDAIFRTKMRVHGVAANVKKWAVQYRKSEGVWPAKDVLVSIMILPVDVTYVDHGWDQHGNLLVDFKYDGVVMREIVFADE